ncbi:MAG: hypothetical protein KF735_18355 [Chelatococcus sp.]|jgi:hypothetical protein|uniref:hypothetical protein n=1 Tax=unclassified Chelatococcus TaxID=2638111 RepID=UPI001BCA90B3|nr:MULTISPECIES: hypothetical protein [unclassified Chelatococcus]CAH1673602.1 conserved membrane hypothetical protein [Hyphomicrobiales bacterium]MBS7738803.1 hypothetical protein [Chelatococcus sp. HY11]MBX3539608.1 hypothetical protein [Chelatococcus sp.]MBX3543207.1 hypothetical protein [Chelatococcus sp.]MCO5076667.1 hypothetical protein [Chelatococcus sp.]
MANFGTPGDASAGSSRHSSFWMRELPYLAILILTACGVGYVSLTRHPIPLYWQFMAVVIAIVCISVGWPDAPDARSRWRLVWTQVLHWGAFLLAMYLVFLPSVQAIANIDSTGLIILLILALSTFVAGVHIGSWQMGANGVVMGLAVPTVAWLDQSALILTLILVVALAAAGVVVWYRLRG